MAIITTYQSEHYPPPVKGARYVRFNPRDGLFIWIITGRGKPNGPVWDYMRGTVDEIDLPFEVALKARQRGGIYPPYVDWPE